MVTLTAVKPPARFGVLKIKDGNVLQFKEKSKKDLLVGKMEVFFVN